MSAGLCLSLMKLSALNLASCELAAGYVRLNSYLMDQTATSDVETNLKLAKRLLSEFDTQIPSPDAHPDYDEHLHEALVEVEKLQQIPDESPERDSSEHRILLTLAAKTNGHKYNPQGELSRIEWIIRQVSLSHALNCMPIYPSKLEEMYRKIGAEHRALVESFARKLFGQEPANPTSPNYTRLLVEREHLDLDIDSLFAASHIRNYAPNSYLLGSILRQYLLEPCNSYVFQLGSDLFEPAMFDEQMFESLNSAYNLKDPNLAPYLRARAIYKVCAQ